MILVCVGGSGSLGKAILNEQELLLRHGISKLRVLSRDEHKQASLMADYKGSIPLDCYLGDMMDAERMAFGLQDAHYVIHCAAQKHVDKFALDVKTGYKSNILGTQNVAEGFLKSRNAVSGIFISTDKAVNPTTAYGVSKLAATHLWLWYNTFQKNIRFGVCTYGNVFGSAGSVIHRWTDLAKQKKALPITDVDCTRFFITLPDAAKFVIRSLFENQSREHFPDMKAAPMTALADVIWRFHNETPLEHDVIGMRGVEKVHEELNGKRSDSVDQFSMAELKSMYEAWL